MTACWKLLRYGRFMAESAIKFPASSKRYLWNAVDKLRKAEEEWNKIGVLEILTDGTARETTTKESAAGDAAKDAEG